MQLDVVRARFENAGHRVSPREDVNEAAAAWFLNMSPGTLRNWRGQGRAPAYVKLASGIWYPIEGLLDFLEKRRNAAA